MRQIGIHLLQSNTEFDIEYTYLAEEELIQNGLLARGSFVDVPFGYRTKVQTGIVTSIDVLNQTLDNSKLKTIKSVNSDIRPPLEEYELTLAERMSKMYFCSIGECVRCMIPPSAPKGRSVRYAFLSPDYDEAKAQSELRNITHIRILEILKDGAMPASELAKIAGCGVSAINTLAKKGYIQTDKRFDHAVSFAGSEEKNVRETSLPTYDRHELNEEQQKAYDFISALIRKKKFAECLVHGVTGSGKTELYMHLIAETIEQGGSVLMLVPEIALTPQMTAHFKHRFGSRVAVLHSRLSPRERNAQWNSIKNGDVSVAVGARSAIFAPFKDLRLIILDEEHESSYRSEDSAPRYHAAEVAEEIGKIRNAVVIYGSATPRAETFYRAVKHQIYYMQLTKRAGRAALPEIIVEDMRQAREDGTAGGNTVFGVRLKKELEDNYRKGKQAMLFIHRRGYAKQLLCKACGSVMKCGKCNLPMTYHEQGSRLICHHCGRTVPAPVKCPLCGSDDLDKRGIGTQKAADELQTMFPEAKILRMDTDTTSGKDGHEKILSAFASGDGAFLVGTQMIAKGHDFPNVTLVGIISADSLINMPDYKAEERAFQLLTQMSGRAGRGGDAGKVIIQAYNIDDYAITSCVNHSYMEFYKNEIVVREALGYPPFTAMCTLRFSGEDDKSVYKTASDACGKMRELNDGEAIEILGPARAEIPKVNNKYRWTVTLKAGTRNEITDFLSYWTDNGKILKKIKKGTNLSIMFDGT